MPSIYDNITSGTRLGPALREALVAFDRMDVASGYLDLRGWSNMADIIESKASGAQIEGPVARILVGMVMPSDAAAMLSALQDTVQPPAYGTSINVVRRRSTLKNA